MNKEIAILKEKLTDEIIKDLRHKEQLLFNLIDNLQVYFNDDERFIKYLKEQCNFNNEDIKETIIFSDEILESEGE